LQFSHSLCVEAHDAPFGVLSHYNDSGNVGRPPTVSMYETPKAISCSIPASEQKPSTPISFSVTKIRNVHLYSIGSSVFSASLLCSPVNEQFLAFLSEKTAGDGDAVIALLENEPAGDEASSPLVVFRTALAAISGNVFLGDAVDDRANSSPHAGAGAHGAGLVRGVEYEVGQVAAIAA